MLSYQFNHVEAFARSGPHRKNSTARKPSMWGIRDEMIRAPGACSHVADPQPPNVVFGMHPSAAFDLAADRARQAMDKIGRRLRPEALVVLVGAATWPITTAEVSRDPGARDLYLKWRAATIAWLQSVWGDVLTSVVEHMDEERPHIHYVVVPKVDPNRHLRIESVHAGFRASSECEQAGGKPREQKAAYQSEMKRFQDDYYYQVGVRFGLTRMGPGRQRLTRDQWKQQKRQAAALAQGYARLEDHYSRIKIKAREYVAEKTAAANATARSKINDVVMQSHHDTILLKNQIEEKDAIIARQAELLAELGVDRRWKT